MGAKFNRSAAIIRRLVTVMQRTCARRLLEQACRAAAQALAAGITTIRDLGDRGYVSVRLRDELADRPSAGPEILASGPPITRTQGRCWFLGGEAGGSDDLVAAVDNRVRRGVDVVKVMATGGHYTPGWGMHESQYTPAELRLLADRAHRQGLPVTAHAHGADGIVAALETGFRRNRTPHVRDRRPRVSGGLGGGRRAGGLRNRDQRHRGAVARRGCVAGGGRADGNRARCLAGDVPPGSSTGGPSDAGIRAGRPHDVLPHGAISFAGLGMTNAEALLTITHHPAAACGVADRKARLVPGFDADLVAFDGHPLSDITALLRPLVVVRAGERIEGRRSIQA